MSTTPAPGGNADKHEQSLAAREAAIRTGEQLLAGREVATRLREADTERREQALQAREELAREQAATRSASIEAQLREANERLVIASVRAQTLAEAADQTATRMAYMAEHDFLTGLPNRSVLTDRLTQAIAMAQRHNRNVALMFIDLDHFKHINDSLGHATGDRLLQSVAKRLLSCVRASDTVSRQGGDEFVVLLSEVEHVEDAAKTAEKLIETMAEPHLIDGHRLHATLSVGMCLYPDDGKDVDALIRNADTAMYHAKKNGRNIYQRFTVDMNTRAVKRQSIEEALRHAVEHNELLLHYQPKVNLESGAITGVEALLRWQRSAQRLVFPAEFVKIAEDCGLIVSIGNWVLRESCRQMVAWKNAGIEVGQIAVNVSAVEFHGTNFLAGVRAILDDTGLDPHRLELELTESVLMRDTLPATATLHALKDLGVRIAVDDFGTGYSSLSYLRHFPIDTLKIDQSFVQNIGRNGSDGIVSAIIAMGESLDLQVVAEGIETAHQHAYLESRKCGEGQGFLFGRPVPSATFVRQVMAAQMKTGTQGSS